MAEILRYVDPNAAAGGNGTTNGLTGANCAYVSLAAWEASTQQDLTDAGGDTARVVCSSDDAGSTHAADTTACTIDGWTTSATCYITIEAASSHGGKWNDNIYRLTITSSSGITLCVGISESFVDIKGIQIKHTAPGGNSGGIVWSTLDTLGAATLNISKCIVRGVFSGTASGLTGVGSSNSLATVTANIINCVIYDYKNGTSGQGIYTNSASNTINVYNCTIVGCYNGIWRDTNGTIKAINNIVKGSGDTLAYVGTFTSSNYNATDGTDTGDGGAQSLQSANLTFVDEAGDDFHLASDSDAVDAGTPDPGSGLFSDDIDGVARGATWDIGADEYVAAGGVSAVLSGTVTASITEADIVAGGKNIIITLTGDTFILN